MKLSVQNFCGLLLILASSPALACAPDPPAGAAVEPASFRQHSQQSVAEPPTSAPSGGSQVTIEPYLTHLGSTSATLAWRGLNAVADRFVLLRLADGEVTVFEGTDAQQQVVKLEGLLPDSEYSWHIMNVAATMNTWRGSFRTLPLEQERRFAVIGHTHGSEHFGHYSDHLLASTIANSNPQFLVHAGDCVYYSTARGWKKDFFDVFRPVLDSAPIYISPGNHDSGWPFIDGTDLRPFQELFPHPFPEKIRGSAGAAYYDLVQGPVHFLFLSYVTDLAEGTPQHAWIQKTLRASTSEFNIVVLGGMNNYYDKSALRALLSAERVDAVLRGDGSASGGVLSQPTTYPIFTLGTANSHPHPWLDARATPEQLVFREMDATGKGGKIHWIHSRRERDPVLILQKPKITSAKNQIILSYSISPPIRSDKVHGLQFKLQGASEGKITYLVTSLPKTRLGQGESGFRSQYHSLSSKDKMVASPIRSQRPIRGGSYEIKEVRVKLIGTKGHPKLKVNEAWLY